MKKASKKKRGAEKEKKIKKKTLDEKETLTFEQQIVDNNRQLARLRTRNVELEEEIVIAKENFRQLEEDRSDVIAHLKRDLEEKSQESKELLDRVTALEQLHQDELAAFKKKEDAMDLEFRTMENNLSSEVKLSAGKLNALEEWRLARIDLMQKFEAQEKAIAEQEDRHKATLYEAEQALITGKAKMKKEMEERLNNLSEAFRKATNLRVAESTHRTIRENMALNKEIDEILLVYREIELCNKEYKDKDKILKLQCELFETESKISLRKTLNQNRLINQLLEKYKHSALMYEKAKRENFRLTIYEKIFEDWKKRCELLEEKVRFLKHCILRTRKDKEKLFAEIREKDNEYYKLKSILDRVKNCIKEALEFEENISEKNYCSTRMKEKLFLSLQEILEKKNITSILAYTASQVENINCPYVKGNLGLIQSSVFEEDNNTKEETEIASDEYEEVEEEESFVSLKERRPSCLLSNISSSIPSPSEESSHKSLL